MKKTMALVLAVVLLLTMSVQTMAFELDSVETAVEFAEPLAEEEGVQSQDVYKRQESKMSKFKRILTVGITAVMLLAVLSVSAFAATTKFTDVNAKDETLSKAVSLLEGLGVAKGTTETTFGTNENVTRQQMAAFIYRLMKKGSTLEGGDNNTPFEDLYDDTYYGMVSWANAMGIIKGVSATEFDPDGSIILKDAYTMLVRAPVSYTHLDVYKRQYIRRYPRLDSLPLRICKKEPRKLFSNILMMMEMLPKFRTVTFTINAKN